MNDTTPTDVPPLALTRRQCAQWLTCGLGAAALSRLSAQECRATTQTGIGVSKRVIYIHHIGAPSQLELFDHKPQLAQLHGTPLPDSVRAGQRLTAFTANQESLPIAAPQVTFGQYGASGAWLSNLLPYHREIVDDLCIVKSVHTDAINHVSGACLTQTGVQQPGRPSVGAWVHYGLGSLNDNLPAFVVMVSEGSAWTGGEAVQSHLWGNGFLPGEYHGVRFRKHREAMLYLDDVAKLPRAQRRRWVDLVQAHNSEARDTFGDPEVTARIAQWETAYQMQTSVPELTDLSQETEATLQMYGDEARQPGTFAANCLLARRLVERNVRFVQLFHRGWDHHERINTSHPKQCRDVDQPASALVRDLKQRGLLEDTLIVWGSEFGRTVFSQGDITQPNYGRDHHPRCFTVWLAGGGTRPGITYGETDDYSYNITQDPVHIHDLNATILHCVGLHHEQLTFRHRGHDFRLTNVSGEVVHPLLA